MLKKDWQDHVLFFTAVGGVIFFIVAPEFGSDVADNPGAYTGIGAILTYVLTRRTAAAQRRSDAEAQSKVQKEEDDDSGPTG